MVDFQISIGIRKLADKIKIPINKVTDAEWFDEDIKILLADDDSLATLVVDVAFDVPSAVEFTLDSGVHWILFNKGELVTGYHSLFVEVINDDQVNFRAKGNVELIRVLVSSVP